MNNAGECPKCKSHHVYYGESEHYDSCIGYEITCRDCGFEGTEWYDVVFSGFTDRDNKELI